MDGLTVGRIVHYVLADGEQTHQAAIVVDVLDKEEGAVTLYVFPPSGLRSPYHVMTCHYDVRMTAGTWHWIERA